MNNWLNYIQNLRTLQRQSNSKNERSNKVYQNILEVIGNTPLVKLNKIPKDHGLECDIYAKCEYFNPGGSIKDRVAHAMIQEAIANGAVTKDTVLVEPTSGNTGIGVVFVASLKGNKSIIIMSEKNSDEKVNTMRLLGAEVIQIKPNMDDIKIAQDIKDSNPKGTTMVNQFENDVNPSTHYNQTGEEINEALGPVDLAVMGAGTGGTMTGVAYRLKEYNPKCLVVAADPEGSILFNKNGRKHPFLVEGISSEYVPIVLDKAVVDSYEVVTDEEALLMARELCKKEGLLCGGSGGLITAAAVKAAKRLKLKTGQKVVVILPDGIRNYMSKFVSDQWMEAHRFIEPPQHDMKWWKAPVTDLPKFKKFLQVSYSSTCAEAYSRMKKEGYNAAVVVDDKGYLVGAVSIDSFRNYATNPTKLPGQNPAEYDFKAPVTDYIVKHIFKLLLNDNKGVPSVGLLSRVLDITPFVIIGTAEDSDDVKFKPYGLFTANDILEYIYRSSKYKRYS